MARRLAVVTIGGVLLLAFAGCARENQNALVIVGIDSVVTVASLAVPGLGTEPGGTAMINAFELVSFDASTFPDAFGRRTPLDDRNQWPFWTRRFGDAEWNIGSERTYLVPGMFDGTQDPRLPALMGTYDYDLIAYFVEGNGNGISNNIFGGFCCVGANERVVIGLARMGLTTNGELDASQVLLGQAVDNPDELFFLGSSPGGDPLRRADLFNLPPDDYPYDGGNPWIFGYVDSDATGDVGFDVVISSFDAAGNQIYTTTADPDDSYFAPNQAVAHNFPQYNYVVVYGTNPDGSVDYNRPLMRTQVGSDLNQFGAPVSNGFAPFPTAAATPAELLSGDGSIVRPDSLEFGLDYMKELDGTAVYKVWAVDAAGLATGLDFIYTAPGGVPDTGATSFNGGVGTHTIKIEYPDDAVDIVHTIEASAAATSMSNVQLLWTSGIQEAGSAKTTSPPVIFGTFNEERTWAISGTGGGGLLSEALRYLYNNLARPPVGYKYVAWLQGTDAVGDTIYLRLPDETFTTPPPEFAELTDADTDLTISDLVQPAQILRSFTQMCVTAPPNPAVDCILINEYDTFILTLEPKAGIMSEPSGTRVLQGVTPAR
jgi:hypothetical protein